MKKALAKVYKFGKNCVCTKSGTFKNNNMKRIALMQLRMVLQQNCLHKAKLYAVYA